MKPTILSFGALASGVVAFPTVLDQLQRSSANEKRLLGITPGFNAAAQYVSTTGAHTFVPPDFDAGDVRGPCPGLNAMANHGYLPHNGVGGHLDFIQGTLDVFGMAADMSAFLTVVGGTLDGDGLSWSIGGPVPSALSLGGLLGEPQGISGSHNKYESDASPTRGDLYLNGDDYKLQMDQWEDLYARGQANGDSYTLDVLNEFRSARWDYSLNNNPYFFNGPFTGVLVAPAAYEFIYRFMGNKSAENPEGYLNGDVLMSFFSMTKNDDGSFTHTPGNERIPDNWYKRAIGDEYSIPLLALDTVAAALEYPKFLSVGGNTGTVNSFVGVLPEDITEGVFNAATLTQGNNLACFSMQFLAQAAPDLIKGSGVISDILGAVTRLTGAVSTAISGLSCPQLTQIDESQFDQFPGYSEMKPDGTY
ncbi:Aromatic peroxygenase [Lachnellula hyalina]|uniref:Aromatic peroxygenase n=1 Tax=Lachnellula hyalina TaxID=1316788 RepID=A0A8H8QW73_9HELO|nr:Aromatic peroxygenase [Lachnellula hyalina]TVY23957.1 Aromatic peroxygenase [Lachnellula hyalina]